MARLLAGLILLLVVAPVFGQPRDWEEADHRHRGDGARILVFRDYHLEAGETVRGPVVVFGGAATIDGHADDDVVVLGGRVRVGPKAIIDGDLVAMGGDVIVDPQARIYGDINETVVRFPDFDGRWVAGVALAATILRLLVVVVVALALALAAPDWVRRISWRAADGPASSAAIGLACQIGFVPALVFLVVTLAVTIVGAPLIGLVPFLIAAAAVAGTAGFTAVAAGIGARLRGTTVEASNALAVDVLLGFAAVSVVSVAAQIGAFSPRWGGPMTWGMSGIGFLVEYLVWTIGIGAACATLVSRWNGPAAAAVVPPPMPPSPAAI